ncbi:MAG: hypothetical protein SGI74_12850 [Oligoflexia bacterium]|nr:hypothetical protein [Oligoflexia bacterium]
MNQWVIKKIQQLNNRYRSFSNRVGSLLGEPPSNVHIPHNIKPKMIDELDLLWNELPTREQNTQQLLTLLSGFYKAGFIVKSHIDGCRIKNYFLENKKELIGPLLDQTFVRFTPSLKNSKLIHQPQRLAAHALLKTLGLQKLTWEENSVAIHFWLYPDESTSLILMSDIQEPLRYQIVRKTQALIQHRFGKGLNV